MRRRSGEVPLPPGFQPPDVADAEFSGAELALIAAARARFGWEFNEPDALNLARVAREMEEARQRQRLDDITAAAGLEKRKSILAAEAARLGTTPNRLRELTENPQRFRAIMEARRRYGNVDVETAISLLAEEENRRQVHAAVVTDRWAGAFNRSKPPRGDDWRRMDPLGPMVAAEINAEAKVKAAFKKRQKADRQPPKSPEPKKPSWRKNPQFKEAAVYFAATGRGIVPMRLEQLNIASGREAEVLEAERQLDLAGFPWPDGET